MKTENLRKWGQVTSLPFAFSPSCFSLSTLLLVLVMAAALWVGTAHAQTPEGSYDEDEAQAIDQMLMCPVCPAESIDQAQVPLARQMRQRVREMLAGGATRQEVLEYFADRYGQNVLASPPKSGLNLLAWVLPVVGVLAALGVGLLVLRSMRGRNGEAFEETGPSASADQELAPYLAAVDRSLELGAVGSQENAGEGNAEDDKQQ